MATIRLAAAKWHNGTLALIHDQEERSLGRDKKMCQQHSTIGTIIKSIRNNNNHCCDEVDKNLTNLACGK